MSRLAGRLLLAALAAAGAAGAYEGLVHRQPLDVGAGVRTELEHLLGPGVSAGLVDVDLLEGAALSDVRVTPPGAPGPALAVARVRVRHTLLDLLCGRLRLRRVELDGPEVTLLETEAGVVPAVSLRAPEDGAPGPLPELRVARGRVRIQGREGSTRLAPGAELTLGDLEAEVLRTPEGALAVRGGFRTQGLGQDDVRIALQGSADADGDALSLRAVWDPLTLTPELLAALAPDVSGPLRSSPIRSGRLEADIRRSARGAARPEAAELEVSVRWLGAMTAELADLPGLKDLAPDVKTRLTEVFGEGSVDLAWEDGRLVVRALTARLATGQVSATGWAASDGSALSLRARLTGLSLEDPRVRRALGREGELLGEVLVARGRVDAELLLEREGGGPLRWEAVVTLVDATLSYLGEVNAQGQREGFPYAMEHANGVLRLTPEGVRVEGLVGRHGEGTTVRVLPWTRTTWQGEETGYLRFTPQGPALSLSIEALDVPTDADLHAAVKGSEFPWLLDTYRVEGVVDRVEVEVVRRPAFDPVTRTDIRITLDGERFAWARFPLPLERVRGIVTLTRPVLPAPGREGDPDAPPARHGNRLHLDMRGEVAQPGGPAPVSIRVDVDQTTARGRLAISARDVEAGGPVAPVLAEAPLTAGGLAKVWAWLGPSGRADLEGDFPLEEDPAPLRLLARLKGVTVVPDAPAGDPTLAVRELTGVISVVGDEVRASALTGRVRGALLELEGRLPDGLAGGFTLDVRTREPLPLTPDVVDSIERLAACSPLLPAGLRLDGPGRAQLDLRVVMAPGEDCPTLPRVGLRELDLGLRWRGGLALRAQGDALDVEGDSVRALGLTLTLPGARIRAEDGRFGPAGVVGRFDLTLDGFTLDEELLGLVPDDARDAVRALTGDRRLMARSLRVAVGRDESVALEGDLGMVARAGAPAGGAPRGTLTFTGFALSGPDPLERRTLRGAVDLEGVTWEEEVGLTGLTGRLVLDRLLLADEPSGAARLEGLAGRVEGLRFSDLSASVRWDRGLLHAEPVRGTLAGGTLRGRFVLRTGEPRAFEAQAHVEGFDVALLRDDLAPTGPPYRGRGTLEVRVQNRSGRPPDLSAAGSLRVRHGHLGDLPALASLFAALSNLLPGHTRPSFEELDADFTLRGETLRFARLELRGPLATLPGRGTLTLDGRVDLTFTPDIVKNMLLPGVMAVPLVGDVLRGALQEQLFYAVRVHGDLDSTETDIVPFPPLGIQRRREVETPPAPATPPRRLPRLLR